MNSLLITHTGYLLKRKGVAQAWSCVHGGSSCSIIAIVRNILYVANVGDSSAIISTTRPILRKSFIKNIVDSANLDSGMSQSTPSEDTKAIFEELGDGYDTLVITAEHSPENPDEFLRLRKFRQREGKI
jgi:serine/threonine protein phosphatase PrpC